MERLWLHPHRQHKLTWLMCIHAWAHGAGQRACTHTHTHTQPPKHTLCWITKVLGSTLPGLLCDLDVPPRLAFDPLCFTNNTLTKTTQQATSYELSTDKTGSYRSPRSGVCKSDGKSWGLHEWKKEGVQMLSVHMRGVGERSREEEEGHH